MKKKKKVQVLALLVIGLIQVLTGCTKNVTTTGESIIEETKQPNIKQEIRAQDDFYGYVNKDILQNMEIPFDQQSNGLLHKWK